MFSACEFNTVSATLREREDSCLAAARFAASATAGFTSIFLLSNWLLSFTAWNNATNGER